MYIYLHQFKNVRNIEKYYFEYPLSENIINTVYFRVKVYVHRNTVQTHIINYDNFKGKSDCLKTELNFERFVGLRKPSSNNIKLDGVIPN